MTPVDTTEPLQGETLSFDFDLPHPPGKVWRALTDADLLAEWLLPVVGRRLPLDIGATFTFRADPLPRWGGIVDCRVVDVELHRRLSYTWVVGDIETVLTFTLAPTASGTRLSLVHAGFGPEPRPAFGGARYGWKLMGDKLVDLLGRIA